MTRYEQGFMNKCAEYGLDVETSVELMKYAKEQYGAGPKDMLKDIKDEFRKGGLRRNAERQNSFNQEYADAGFGKRVKMTVKHPIRAHRATYAIGTGNLKDPDRRTKKAEDAYLDGFAAKCAEWGLSPEQTVEFAKTALFEKDKQVLNSGKVVINDAKKSYKRNKRRYDAGKQNELDSLKNVGNDTINSANKEYKKLRKKAGIGGRFNVGDLIVGGGVQGDGRGGGSIGGIVANPRRGGALLSAGIDKNTRDNTLAGAGIGALIGLIREKMKGDDKKKQYLRKALKGALLGGGAGLAGTMITSAPSVVDMAKDKISGGIESAQNAIG